MKTIRILALLSATTLMLAACGSVSSGDGPHESDSNGQAITEQEGVRGVELVKMTSTGEIPYEYFEFGAFVSYASLNTYYGRDDGGAHYIAVQENWYANLDTSLFPYRYDNKYGYADVDGNIVIPERFDDATAFFEDKAFVREGTQWKIIDKQGEILKAIPEEYTTEVYQEKLFVNGKAILAEPICYKEGFANFNGVILTIIDSNMTIRQQRINFDVKEAKEYRVINTSDFQGVLVEFDEYGQKNYNDKVLYRLYDINGNLIWKTDIAEINVVDDHLPYGAQVPLTAFVTKNGYMNIVGENGKWGLLNLKTGQVQIPCTYDFVGAYSDGLVQVCKYGKWGYLDINGEESIKPSYSYATAFFDGYAVAVNEEEKYVLIDGEGTVIAVYDAGPERNGENQLPIGPIMKDVGAVVLGRFVYDLKGERIHVRDASSAYDDIILPSFVLGKYVVTSDGVVTDGGIYKIVEKE